MIVDAIKNGIVIDHITAGHAMELYSILNLDELDCTVAILKNVPSKKKGKKDIIERAFFGPITPEVPASILQLHPDLTVIYSEN